MNINVSSAMATCDRCAAQSQIYPQILRHNWPVEERQPQGFTALDDAGNVWRVLAAERPVGWTAGPKAGEDMTRGLCVDCSAAWTASIEAFMIPPPPPVEEPVALVEGDVNAIPVASNQPAGTRSFSSVNHTPTQPIAGMQRAPSAIGTPYLGHK